MKKATILVLMLAVGYGVGVVSYPMIFRQHQNFGFEGSVTLVDRDASTAISRDKTLSIIRSILKERGFRLKTDVSNTSNAIGQEKYQLSSNGELDGVVSISHENVADAGSSVIAIRMAFPFFRKDSPCQHMQALVYELRQGLITDEASHQPTPAPSQRKRTGQTDTIAEGNDDRER